jgi:hypothetical protein
MSNIGVWSLQAIYNKQVSGTWVNTPYVPPAPAVSFGFSVGGVITSTANRLTFATDTNTVAVRGPLSLARFGFAGTGNSVHGWYAGGLTSPSVSRVDRITYASDTPTASIRGTTFEGQTSYSSTDGLYGWFAGFARNPSPSPDANKIARMDFSNDNVATLHRGTLIETVYNISGTGNTTHGYVLGGIGPTSRVQRITYSDDTATTTTRGPLSIIRYGHGSVQNSTNAWIAGGAGSISSIDRMQFSTDTATAVVRSNLSEGTSTWIGNGGLSDNVEYGWFVGAGSPGMRSTVQRLSYNNDTSNTSIRGPLAAAQYLMAKSSA